MRPIRSRLPPYLVALALVSLSSTAHAQPWMLSFEAPGAFPVAGHQRAWFEPGIMPSAAIYKPSGRRSAIGLRLRAGVLRNGPAPSDPTLADFGLGGFAGLSLAMRLGSIDSGARGPWVEASAGGGVTGTQVRPTLEVGMGWGVRFRGVNVGPSFRLLVVQRSSDPMGLDSARLALLGFELTTARRRSRGRLSRRVPIRVVRNKKPAPPPPPAPALDSDGDGLVDKDDKCPEKPEDRDGFEDSDGCPDPDNDQDKIADTEDKCPDEAEVVNGIDDQDGCPDKGVVEVIEDRIVLGSRVLFDFKKARVKRRGKKALRAVVKLLAQHPEWKHIRIEGHSCTRGRERGNWMLSALRARNVRRALVRMGIARDRLSARSLGSTKPRYPGHSERELRRNRRVELVIITAHRKTHGVRTDKRAQPAVVPK